MFGSCCVVRPDGFAGFRVLKGLFGGGGRLLCFFVSLSAAAVKNSQLDDRCVMLCL